MIDLNESHVAVVRGIRNCGQHHEENSLSPAVQFSLECAKCAGLIFLTIWNASQDARTAQILAMTRR
jgi:hypothetical protein